MNDSIKLSDNQKRVILGLCLYPMSSDSEIAKKLSVKRSTFSTIKKQLSNPPYEMIHSINIPNAKALGSSVLAVGYIDFNPNKLDAFIHERPKEILERLHYFPNLVLSMFGHHSGVSILVSKSFTDIILAHNEVAGFYHENKLTSPQDLHLFIGRNTEDGLHQFHEYGRLLAAHWGIKLEEDYILHSVFSSLGKNTERVSSLGWSVYKELISNPGTSTVDLARISGKPRNTIARWVNFFEENHLFQVRYIPNFVKLGFNILTICFLSIRGYDTEKRLQILEMVKKHFYPIDLFSSKKEIVFLSISKDYFSLRAVEGDFFDEIRKNGLNVNIIKKKVFSTQTITFPKTLSESMIPLCEYLQSSGKFDLLPFSNQERE
ncbi:MAG: hypothetical protein KAT16_03805 [Candidatus Heimdallarchaeota archaeon]|nr:hypothetical protein [Candidatus Heimdallarchaeota archaeon]